MLKNRYQIMLICAIVLGVFYISISAEINSVDDQGMINDLVNSNGITLKALFLPQSESGGYYRPIIGLSYELDRIVSLADPKVMHLHNIILHLINVILVFWLARFFVKPDRRKGTWIPFVSALCFGLHPIVTESVNWISGRTDVLAGTFVLLSAVYLLKFRERYSISLLLVAIMSVCFGIMTKESAVGFLFGAAFILSARSEQAKWVDEFSSGQKTPTGNAFVLFVFFSALGVATAIISSNYWLVLGEGVLYFLVLDFQKIRKLGVAASTRRYVRHLIIIILVTGASLGFFALMRTVVFASNTSRISQTLKLIFQDPNYAFSVFLGTFGFYVKKFFFPFPQNFAIREVDPVYNLIGIFLLFGCIYLMQRRTLSNAFVFSGVFLLSPSFPIAFGTIAWTAYAERYIYISAAFWVIVVCCYAAEKVEVHRLPLRYQYAGVVLVIVTLGVCTFQRNVVWNTNLLLYADTVVKNPIFKAVRNEYMVALAREKNYPDALQQYQAASSVYTLEYHENLDLNMAKILALQGKHKESLALYELSVKRGGAKSISAHENTIEYLQKRIWDSKDQLIKEEFQKKLLRYYEKLYDLDHNPLTAYRTGQVALSLHDKKTALNYFTEAKNGFDNNNIYKTFSEKLIASIKDSSS